MGSTLLDERTEFGLRLHCDIDGGEVVALDATRPVAIDVFIREG